jgi:pimeloyl-ACP methyl ester carboxylesterase
MNHIAKYSLVLLLLCLNIMGVEAQELNTLSIADVTGSMGGKVSLPVNLDNTSHDIVAVQFRLTVPKGITVDNNSAKFGVRTDNHSAVIQKNDNSYSVIVYSAGNSAIGGNSGQLMTIDLTIGTGFTPGGDYDIELSEVLLGNKQGKNVATGFSSGKLHIAEVPDFVVTDVQSDESSSAPNGFINVSWKVTNQGGLASTGGWSEQVSLIGSDGHRQLLGTVYHETALNAGETVSREARLRIPQLPGIGGAAQVQVKLIPNADAGELTEHRANNTTVGQQTINLAKELVLTVPQTVEEGNRTLSCQLSRSGNWNTAQTFGITVEGDKRLNRITSVTIGKGQSTVWFSLKLTDDAVLNESNLFTVTASGQDYEPASSQITVTDNELPSLSLTASKSEVEEGETFQMTVTTSRTSAAPIVVRLICESGKRFNFPAQVTIPAGERSATFDVKAIDNEEVAAVSTIAFRASAELHDTSGECLVIVTDNDMPQLEMQLTPATVSEGAGHNAIIGSIRRLDHLDSKITIKLSDSADGLFTYSSEKLTMKKGESEVKFAISLTNDLTVNGDRDVQVTAAVYVSSCDCYPTGQAGGSVSQTITVLDDDGPTLRITPSATAFLEGSDNNALTISCNTTLNSDLSISISSDYDTALNYAHTAVIPAGQTSVVIPVTVMANDTEGDDKAFTFQATAQGYTSGTCWSMVTDQSLPDAVISSLDVNVAEAEAESDIELTIVVKNSGNALLRKGTPVSVYLGTENVLTVNTDQILSAGASTTMQAIYTLPKKTGDFTLMAVVNANKRIGELLYTNNSSEEVPIRIVPCIQLTAKTDKTVYQQGDTVYVSGVATGTKNAKAQVEVYFIRDDIRQTVSTTTDDQGRYAISWVPQKGLPGHYKVGACYPGSGISEAMAEIDVYGLTTWRNRVTCQFGEGETYSGVISITNPGVLSQTGIHVEQLAMSDNCEFSFDEIPQIGAGKTVNLNYTIKGNGVTSGYSWQQMPISIKSNEGSSIDYTIYYYVDTQRGRIRTNTSYIKTSMTMGKSREYPLYIQNTGKGETGTITLALPSWIETVTPRQMPSLASGDSATIMLRFVPTESMRLNVPVTGHFGINCTNGYGASVSFQLTPVSEETGTLTIDVVDEFTFFTTEAPHVSMASVKVKNMSTGQVVAQGVTNEKGTFSAEMTEGWYSVTVDADNHESQTQEVVVDPGEDNKQEVFLSYDAITYDWKVEETTVDDKYSIETIVKFETRVPKPVITVSWPQDRPEPGSVFPITVTNKGFINAKDVHVDLSITGSYTLEFLNSPSLDVLAPQQSVVFYAKVKQKSAASRTRAVKPVLIDCVEIDGGAYYTYDCGPYAKQQYVTIYKKWGRCSSGSSYRHPHYGGGYSGIGRPWYWRGDYIDDVWKQPDPEPTTICDKDKPEFVFRLVEVDENGDVVSPKKWWKGIAADGASRLKIVLAEATNVSSINDIKNVTWELPEGNNGSFDNVNALEPIYTAPADFPFDIQAPSFTVKPSVTFYYDGERQDATVDIEVTRVPLILLHGHAGGQDCWSDLEHSLVNDGKGIYDRYQVQNEAYSHNLSSFKTNLYVVRACIDKIKNEYATKKILAKKVDLVGHSMGGILARLHVQYVDNTNVHKVITVNTPHSGSEWGDVASFIVDKVLDVIDTFASRGKKNEAEENKKKISTLLKKIGEKTFGIQIDLAKKNWAFCDLAVNSEATDNYLNGIGLDGITNEQTKTILDRMNGIPIRAITTTSDSDFILYFSIITSLGTLYFGDLSLGLFEYLGIMGELNYKLRQSDLVVSLESQKGGLGGLSAPNASADQIHIGSASNVEVIRNVQLALQASGSSDFFSHSGFRPENRTMYVAEYVEKLDLWLSEVLDTHPEILNSNNARGSSVAEKMLIVNIDNSSIRGECNINENQIKRISVFVEMGDKSYFFEEKGFQMQIPSTFAGKIGVFAFVQTNDNQFMVDSTFVDVLSPKAHPVSISCDEIYFDIRREIAEIGLTCKWDDGSITYVVPDAIKFDKAIARYENSQLILQSLGKTKMTLSYGGLTCTGQLVIIGEGYDGSDDEDENDDEENSNSVCSSVTLSIKQEAVMTRQAFRGTLTVNNGHPTKAIQDLKINLEVRDEDGMLATSHEFQINPESLIGFSGKLDFNAGWSLAGKETGTATILFIPTKYAAPTEPKEWAFGGSFSYTDPYTGLTVTRDLNPVTLTVKPSPILDFTYFMQRDILGDDPLTSDIEPMVPAEFALLINNKGNGAVEKMNMTTDQPKITENEKGLAINFEIISSQLNGQEKTMALGGSMTSSFGSIPAHSQTYAQWWLQSSLLGHFTEYNVKATHVTSYGNENLSLLDEVTIHELIHGFTTRSESGTQGRGFLVNDIPDANDQPDEVYFTDGTQQHVTIAADATMTKLSDTSYALKIKPSQAGWTYGSLKDPTNGKVSILSVKRQSDGADIAVDCVWQTDRTLRDGRDPLYENRLHFVGEMPAAGDTYLLTVQPKPEVELKVEAITGLPEETVVLTDQLKEVTVIFNKPIDASTFTTDDITLTCQSNRVAVDGIRITKISDREFTLNLTEATLDDGFYMLTIQTADITDTEGFTGSVGKQAMWTQYGNQLALKIKVSPSKGGSVTPSSARYDFGSNVVLNATAAKSYVFEGWKLGEELVSTDSQWSCLLMENTEVTAIFRPKPYKVTVNYDPTLGEVKNGATGFYDYGTELCLNAVSTDGSFKHWTINGEVVEDSKQTLTITVTDAIEISAVFVRDIYYQTMTLSQGWNWVSSYLKEPLSVEPFSSIANRIVGQTDELISDPLFGLIGNLDAMYGGSSYKIKADQPYSHTFMGHLYDPEGSPIRLHNGWNWISYPYFEELDIDETVKNAEEGDYLVSQTGFAEYANGNWDGSLGMFVPGMGYLYKSASDKNLQWNIPAVARSRGGRVRIDSGTSGMVDIFRYPNTMNVTAQIVLDGMRQSADAYNLYAFVGDELRGASLHNGMNCYLTIYGDEPVAVSFILESTVTGETFLADETLKFRNDVVGSRKSPFVLNFSSATGINGLGFGRQPMTIYNLQGILVSREATLNTLRRLPKGVYIVNGHKFLVK